MGRQGIVSYVVAAAKADFKFGVQLLNMVVPKTAHIDVTRREHTFVSISELDDELQRQGLPKTREIFALDFSRGEDDTEAELVVEAEE